MAETKFLVIDDDPGTCETLADIFKEKGYKVDIAHTGREALAKTKKTAFDVVLIDIKLPDISGTTLLGELKKDYPEMVCIIITGHASIQNAIKALEKGSNGYFIKPLVMEDVILKVEEALDKQRLQQELRESEELYRTLVHTSPDGVTATDLEGNITFVSKRTLELHGFKTADELLGRSALELISQNERKKAMNNLQKTLNQGIVKNVEYTMQRKDGTRFIGEVSASLIKDDQGKPKAFMAITRDITELKQAEEKIRASLKEKEAMLQEIHHRVNNNMQIIISLLRIQSRNVKGQEAKDMFKDYLNRIRSIALVHDKLYHSRDLARIDFAKYTRELSTHLFHSSGVSESAVKIDVNIEDVLLDINTAIPCGLIINELISNSLKHAFPKGREGKILIDMHSHRKRQYTLVFSDNGVGFAKGIDFRDPKSSGMQLVNDLIKQIEGTIELDRKEGTTFTIAF